MSEKDGLIRKINGLSPRLTSQVSWFLDLSKTLRERRYTGQITLHFGDGLMHVANIIERIEKRK